MNRYNNKQERTNGHNGEGRKMGGYVRSRNQGGYSRNRQENAEGDKKYFHKNTRTETGEENRE
ncbi:MAG: hypothetical protein K2I47_09745, partial [Odoribacter sp.]|nr:hypothetical protein [Odoribacter sp.]